MYNTHPEFDSRGDDPSASAGLAACLDHSAGQRYRLNSGLFIWSTWHWRTRSAAWGGYAAVWWNLILQACHCCYHGMHLVPRSCFICCLAVVWVSTDANRPMQRTYTAVEKLILIDLTNDHLPTYLLQQKDTSIHILCCSVSCLLFCLLKLRLSIVENVILCIIRTPNFATRF